MKRKNRNLELVCFYGYYMIKEKIKPSRRMKLENEFLFPWGIYCLMQISESTVEDVSEVGDKNKLEDEIKKLKEELK